MKQTDGLPIKPHFGEVHEDDYDWRSLEKEVGDDDDSECVNSILGFTVEEIMNEQP